jgi:hypothetical protein
MDDVDVKNAGKSVIYVPGKIIESKMLIKTFFLKPDRASFLFESLSL